MSDTGTCQKSVESFFTLAKQVGKRLHVAKHVWPCAKTMGMDLLKRVLLCRYGDLGMPLQKTGKIELVSSL